MRATLALPAHHLPAFYLILRKKCKTLFRILKEMKPHFKHMKRRDWPSNDELHHDSVRDHDPQNLLQHAVFDTETEKMIESIFFFKILTEHQRLELTDCSHARGGQVGVFMLQFAIQSDAPPLPVVGQQRQHRVDFLQRRSRRHRVPDEKEQISFKGNTQNNQKVKISAKFNVTFFTKF